jgi:hypothetical protein
MITLLGLALLEPVLGNELDGIDQLTTTYDAYEGCLAYDTVTLTGTVASPQNRIWKKG